MNRNYQPVSFVPRLNGSGSPKFKVPTNISFDPITAPKTLKQCTSNPSLSTSVDLNQLKMSKVEQFAPQMQRKQHAVFNPRPNYGSPRRKEMSQSLKLDGVEVPEEIFGEKQAGRFVPGKRSYRMSEVTQDPPSPASSNSPNSPASPLTPPPSYSSQFCTQQKKFLRHKERQAKQERKQEMTSPKNKPHFLQMSRANTMNTDIKRSLVLDYSSPQFQHRPQYSTMKPGLFIPKKSRQVKIQDFTKLKQLGAGKYGRVFLVAQKVTGFVCALKVIQKRLLRQQQITDQFVRQVKIQMYLNHPNIIKMYGCFHDTNNIYILLQAGTGGQLYKQLKPGQPLPQNKVAFIMKQVCEAINQIHGMKIIHRDIKPQNIVLHQNIIKLCDFGWSVHRDNTLRSTFCGTPLYVCPQILKGRQYDQKIDIWSIGIMMYQMVVGDNPFKITREQQLIKIIKDEIKIPSYLNVSQQVRSFLHKCLTKNPDDRATIKELINHQFFRKNCQKEKKEAII